MARRRDSKGRFVKSGAKSQKRATASAPAGNARSANVLDLGSVQHDADAGAGY